MQLVDYLHKHKLTRKEFAELIDVHPTHLRSVIVGVYPVSKKMSRLVEKATKGAVTASEIVDVRKKLGE